MRFLLSLLAVVTVSSMLPGAAFCEELDVIALRQRAESEALTPIPIDRFSAAEDAPLEQCSFVRLGPGPRYAHEVKLRLFRTPGSTRRDGFAVDARLVEGVFAPEPPLLPLWYDAHGRLVATVTLPPPVPGAKERPGTREEFLVVRYLPAQKELVAEWQRAVGPNPKDIAFANLPHAVLVEKANVYSSYLRASAYMLCRAALRPVEADASPGPGGTRQPAP